RAPPGPPGNRRPGRVARGPRPRPRRAGGPLVDEPAPRRGRPRDDPTPRPRPFPEFAAAPAAPDSPPARVRAAVTLLLLAVALDLLRGDPPNRWHPVAWIGRLIAFGRARAPDMPQDLALYGTFLILIVAGLAAGVALTAHAFLGELPGVAAPLAQAWLLKCSFSLQGLTGAVELVRGHLVADDLDGARRQVAWHLVSRPTVDLDRGAVGSAAVESLAENLTDGFVAPVGFFVAGTLLGGSGAGMALAWAYRAVNTADAMIGYREAELGDLGRATGGD